MSSDRQFKKQQQRKSTLISFSKLIDVWKVRPINGFEKYLFTNTQTATSNAISSTRQHTIQKRKLLKNIDPARFIYPRDAMGNMLVPLVNRNTINSPQFYLPKYDFVKTCSPKWTIKHVYQSKGVIRYVGPMTYNSINDKSQLSCKSGWTQIGRREINKHSHLSLPFYDTRTYKQVGDPCSKHAIIIGRRKVRREAKLKKLSDVIKRKSIVDNEHIYDRDDHEQIGRISTSLDKFLPSTEESNHVINDLTTSRIDGNHDSSNHMFDIKPSLPPDLTIK